MSTPKKGRKIRTELRKNRAQKTRETDMTRQYREHGYEDDDSPHREQVGKDETTRRRTIIVKDNLPANNEDSQSLEVDLSTCLPGRVLRVGGLKNAVLAENGKTYSCATRRLLKTLSTDQRHIVAAGDRVLFRPEGEDEGIIERIEPRKTILSRASKNRQHVMVANVDQLVIVASAAEPGIKPNLIDRMLVVAEKGGLEPLICINKIDLIDVAYLQPLIGTYGQLGYRVLLTSAETGQSMNLLREAMKDRQSVVSGQSGVGKSTLLNALEPGLGLRTATVSAESQKGRHTTTASQLFPLSFGGFVVDTPGIRQFQLWDVTPEETAGYYRDLRPLVSRCDFPDCTHTHETNCAVKEAVAEGLIDARRYESYCHLRAGDFA